MDHVTEYETPAGVLRVTESSEWVMDTASNTARFVTEVTVTDENGNPPAAGAAAFVAAIREDRQRLVQAVVDQQVKWFPDGDRLFRRELGPGFNNVPVELLDE